ncbi:MAG: RNA pyrophosphohydrolase [Pseudomonadota bacterium]|nr:MAG: RNA pyrophosphohydrolase [Pseudomonadota bacterium]
MIDEDGYRPNVGIVLCNAQRRVFWARRIGERAWQFPQGGIRPHETPEQALYRELEEEIGLRAGDVELIGCTREWLRYRLPRRYIRYRSKPVCVGQKQVWYLLRLVGDETRVRLDWGARPEFDRWRWVDYWEPVQKVVSFKRSVYAQALEELAPLMMPGDQAGPVSASRQLKHR